MKLTQEIFDNCKWIDDYTIIYHCGIQYRRYKINKCKYCGVLCLNLPENNGSYCSRGCSTKDRNSSLEWCLNHSKKIKGKKDSEETKKKKSEAHLGHEVTQETRIKISESQLGIKKGPLSEETILKISGPNNHNWKGGTSTESYCCLWTKEYRDEIKERDGYKCLNPSCKNNSKRLAAHHVDYDKKNCHPNNLISICTSCNSRANKKRNTWKALYQLILNQKYNYRYLNEVL